MGLSFNLAWRPPCVNICPPFPMAKYSKMQHIRSHSSQSEPRRRPPLELPDLLKLLNEAFLGCLPLDDMVTR